MKDSHQGRKLLDMRYHKLGFVILACFMSIVHSALEMKSPGLGSRKHHRSEVVFGNRIPRTYFEVQGKRSTVSQPFFQPFKFLHITLLGFGETNKASGEDPFETGAHDLAMEDAGVHMFNLMTYTSSKSVICGTFFYYLNLKLLEITSLCNIIQRCRLKQDIYLLLKLKKNFTMERCWNAL